MQFFAMTMFNGCHEPANIATAAINLVTPRRSKYEYAELITPLCSDVGVFSCL